MTRNRRFLTSIALTTVAAICISAMGCGDNAGGKGTTKVESTTKKVETSGTDKESTSDGVKSKTKADKKPDAKKDGGKSAPPNADKANGSEAGSSTVPGGGVETPQ